MRENPTVSDILPLFCVIKKPPHFPSVCTCSRVLDLTNLNRMQEHCLKHSLCIHLQRWQINSTNIQSILIKKDNRKEPAASPFIRPPLWIDRWTSKKHFWKMSKFGLNIIKVWTQQRGLFSKASSRIFAEQRLNKVVQYPPMKRLALNATLNEIFLIISLSKYHSFNNQNNVQWRKIA